MKLSDVKQIKQAYSEKETNEYLARGFVILKILSTRSVSAEVDEVKPVFILGL